MNLDSLLGYEEEIRDIAIAISSRDLPKDIDLADCQAFIGHVLRQLGGNIRRNALLARVHLADGLNQLVGRRALQKVSAGPSLQRALDLDVALKCREHDDAGLREFRADRDHRVDAAQVRKS